MGHLDRIGLDGLIARQEAAVAGIDAAGITFTVYEEGLGIDRAWPFDIVPRVIARTEWDRVSAGLVQRLGAINAFIADVYGDQRIVSAGIVAPELIGRGFVEACQGAKPAHDVWAHVCGSDLVRDADGTIYVLEDNLRVPSGDAYPDRLLRTLASIAARPEPTIGVLTPGIYNSAYFEHSFLARAMGVELVEGSDLVVIDDVAYLRTIDGLVRVDVLYRRVDDRYLDPTVFHPESVLGAPGLIGAWRAGNLALANAPGTGVADDKAVYAYVPDMIRYYLGEEPILPNVETFWCADDAHRSHVLAHLDELVVKPVAEAGGYGIVVGPHATRAELDAAAERIRHDPAGYVAQPTLSLSTVPTLCNGELARRHVDLRPFTLLGAESYVTCGGLTRVAQREGSLVVNSSQGGGSKDTWIVDVDATRTGER